MQDWVYGTMSAAELAEQERITSEYLYALVNTVSAHLAPRSCEAFLGLPSIRWMLQKGLPSSVS